MSKQSDAKKQQGYVAKAIPKTCVNCSSFLFETINHPPSPFNRNGWSEEKNFRCSIGGFAVKKMGSCNEFDPKINSVAVKS